jgi:hypothetical protein
MAINISAQIETLREKLAKLEAQELKQLREERQAAQKVVDDLDARIAKLTGRAPAKGKRTRTSPTEVRRRIFTTLKKNPKGLSRKEISDQVGLPYGSVVLFLKRNEKEFNRKDGRFFLK